MDSPINIVRWQNKVRAMFGMRGINPIPTLKDLQPVVVVENDRPEFSFAGGELLAWGAVTQALVAGQLSWVALVNPADTGVLVRIDQIWVNQQATSIKILGPTQVAPTAPYVTGELGSQTNQQRDLRLLLPTVIPSARISQGAGVAPPGTLAFQLPNAQLSEVEIILPPDTGVLCEGVAVATALTIGYRWRERVLERGLSS